MSCFIHVGPITGIESNPVTFCDVGNEFLYTY